MTILGATALAQPVAGEPVAGGAVDGQLDEPVSSSVAPVSPISFSSSPTTARSPRSVPTPRV